jgi:isoleucyl-tRNA synthetase
LPIEFEIEKKLNINSKEQVLELGIKNYNAACREIVMTFAGEWETIVTRLGRWIDFKNDYKTMNITFMESVWWVFKQLTEKGLVYRGLRVMPYSTGCTTPLSNFESGQNYKDVSDPAVTVMFPLDEDPSINLLAWTTTPWTLPSNLALCVNPELDYVKIKDKGTSNIYILMQARLETLYSKKQKDKYEVLETFKGATLVGKTYKPLFDYFGHFKQEGAFRVLSDLYVTAESGTGIVHQAPGFGEDDYRVCLKHGVISQKSDIPCPIDAGGKFTEPVTDFLGQYVKDADDNIAKHIKDMGRLVKKETIVHSYPFCWRSDTPLIYRTVPSWFVSVTTIKDQLLKNNAATYWVPNVIGTGRFHQWLADARDWSISRSRYWGTPIPMWVSDDYEEIVCVGSIEELEKLTGEKITDLHREFIDHLTIDSQKGKGKLKRVEDVFDCWFESGSMPYAQNHYPFENKEKFEKSFPADFIAEGLDQTRGWFYTLLVLGTALFDTAPFKNLIVNGLVLAEDGKKMSKRLKNYPEVNLVIDKYGADALRLYLINSPVVRAESLKFKEEGVKQVIKDVFLQWFNAYRFFVQNAQSYKRKNGSLFTSVEAESVVPTNLMDKWILSLSQSLVKFVREEMDAYRLYTVVPKLVTFIDQLTNWYVRTNRKRLKGDATDQQDWHTSLATFYNVLFTTCRIMAPFTPFLTEMMYQNLKNIIPEDQRLDSIHFMMVPDYDASKVDIAIERAVADLQTVVVAGRLLRDRKKISLRQPVHEYVFCNLDKQFVANVLDLQEYVKLELNCKNVRATSEIQDFVKLNADVDGHRLGKRLGKKLREVKTAVNNLPHDEIVQFVLTGSIEVSGETLVAEDLRVTNSFAGDADRYVSQPEGQALIVMDFVLTPELKKEGLSREVSSRVQQLRKTAGLVATDEVDVYFSNVTGDVLTDLLNNDIVSVQSLLSGMKLIVSEPPTAQVVIQQREEVSASDVSGELTITLVGEPVSKKQ